MQQVEVIPSWASVLFLFHLSPVTTLKKIASWYPIWLQVQFSGVAFICPQCHLHGRQQPLLKFYIIWDHPGALKELRMQGQNSTILVINSSEKKENKLCWRKMTTPVPSFQVFETQRSCWASGIKRRNFICLLQILESPRTPITAWKHGEVRANK